MQVPRREGDQPSKFLSTIWKQSYEFVRHRAEFTGGMAHACNIRVIAALRALAQRNWNKYETASSIDGALCANWNVGAFCYWDPIMEVLDTMIRSEINLREAERKIYQIPDRFPEILIGGAEDDTSNGGSEPGDR